MEKNTKKIKRGEKGEFVDAQIINMTSASEYWNQYLLSDGSILKVKLVVSEILHVEGEYDCFGDPIYQVKSVNVLQVVAPDSIRRLEEKT
jgi:hypothetical protein